MNQTRLVLALAFLVVFLLGCVAAQVLPVPPVRAGTNPQRWEHFCTEASAGELNMAGMQGWELVAVATQYDSHLVACFKRALP